MSYDAPARREHGQRVAAMKKQAQDARDATDNWLSAVLVEVEQEQENSAERRATIAFRKRATKRFSAFVTKAATAEDFEWRVSMIEDGLRETATEVAREYGATNGDDLYVSARTAAGDFFDQPSPWGPGGEAATMQGQSEVCPGCKMTKPVGAACPNCGYNAPAGAGTGGELGGLQQRMMGPVASVKESHPNCTGEGCKFCENKGNIGGGKKDINERNEDKHGTDAPLDEGDMLEKESKKPSGELGEMGTDADEGADSAEGKQYNKAQKGNEQGDGEEDDDPSKESSVKTAMPVSKKDFEAIAAILQQNGGDPALAQQIADYFATQNPNFQNDRFMDAAGAGGEFPGGIPAGPNVIDGLTGEQVNPAAGPRTAGIRTAGIHAASEDMWHHVGAGAELRGDKYQYERVDPSKEMNDSVPGAHGESYPTDTVDEVLEGSKNHPSERKEVLDFDAAENTDPKIKRKVDTEDLGGKNPHKEQKGTGQAGDTFGDSHGVTEAVTDQSDAKLGSTLRFHVL